MGEYGNMFSCWEGYFAKKRKKCIECRIYASCVQQEIFDLKRILEEQKEKEI